VYAWGDGCVLKLFHDWSPRSRAEREFAVTRVVHAAGLAVPAAHELIEVNGRCGIVFERINGVSLLDHTRKQPWGLFGAIQQMAELHARIHALPAPAGLPTQRERLAEKIEAADLPADEKLTARTRLTALPDGSALCHGDFHPGNILITARGPVAIDWGSASCGHPLGDLACTSRLLRTATLPPWAPRYMHLLLRCLRSIMHRAYLKRYFRLHPGSRKHIEAWQVPLAAAAQAWRSAAAGS
jgi:aminoglycoside phosphotransferase (APT) family kinase protein